MGMRQNIRNLVLALVFLSAMSSCEKDFEDINQNPYNPTETSMEALFNGLVSSLQLTWDGQFYVDNEVLYEITQLGALKAKSWQNTAKGANAIWDNYYSSLRNVRELERRFEAYQGDQEELTNVKAMLKIVLAYKTFFVTDLFGDIPFSQAGRGLDGADALRPAYDTQEQIYKSLLDELRWASDNIVTSQLEQTSVGKDFYSFGSFDPLFSSDMKMWQKFANSLLLRYAMRIVEVEPGLSDEIIGDLLNEAKPLIGLNEDVLMRPSAMGFTRLSSHWSFREHGNLRLGNTMWNLMAPIDPSPSGAGILDPRATLFFDTNNDGEWVPFPNYLQDGESLPVEGGIPYGGQRDSNYAIRGNDNYFSSFQYYLIRDENDIPEILMSASEVNFLKAEARLRGIGVPQDDFAAENDYSAAISGSILFWAREAQNASIWENPPAISQGESYIYAFDPSVSLSENNFDLDFIYRQAWISFFRQPWEAFSLWRRTRATPREGPEPEYFRLVYPADESFLNAANYQEAAQRIGGDQTSSKLWWMTE